MLNGVLRQFSVRFGGSRRKQCEEAMSIISKRFPSAKALRDIDDEMLKTVRAGLGELLYKRANHVVGENARVLAAADALRNNDDKKFINVPKVVGCQISF
jgi:galactokinase